MMNYSPSKKPHLTSSNDYWDVVESRVNQFLDSLELTIEEPGNERKGKGKKIIILKKEGFTIKERRRNRREKEAAGKEKSKGEG